MSDNEPGNTECLDECLNLRRTLLIRPLRVAAKPERTIVVDTQPVAQTKERLQRLRIFSFQFVHSPARSGGEFVDSAARLREFLVDYKLFVGIESLDFGGNFFIELLDA